MKDQPMKQYLIGFRVVPNKWYNKIFPLIQWEIPGEADIDLLELQNLVKNAIGSINTEHENQESDTQ